MQGLRIVDSSGRQMAHRNFLLPLLVADDSPEIVRAVRERLEKHPGWQVCGQASNGLEAVSQTSDLWARTAAKG
jgi:hypothetical protein